MADQRIEERFLSTVVLNECADEVYGDMREQWLLSVETRQAWSIIASHYKHHRTTITREEFREQMPGWQFLPAATEVSGLIGSLQKRYIRTKMEDLLEEAEVDADDPVGSLALVMSDLQSLRAQVESGEGENIAKTAGTVTDRYKERKRHKGAVGLIWPWLPLQESTLGASNGMYTIFYARPKNMKSWLVIFLITYWLQAYDRKIVIINRELTVPQFQDRFVAMLAGLPYDTFRRAQLPEEEYELLREATEWMLDHGHIYVEAIHSDGAMAAAEVDALCEKYDLEEGDILLIDGMYFYAGSSDWQLMRDFSKGVQRTTKKRKLVTICTTQGNRNQGKGGADAGEELGLGDGPVMDCDMAIRCSLDEDNQELTLAIRAIREGKPCSFVINAMLCDNFELKYTNDYFGDEKAPTTPTPIGGRKHAKKASATPAAPTANMGRTAKKKSKSGGVAPKRKKAA